nr:acetone carboxylase [Rothia sp. ZJ1223]
MRLGAAEVPVAKCSRKGCQLSAQWQVVWNNPKIHEPSRRKVWLACQEHRRYLEDFLASRGFHRATEPFESELSS